MTVMEPVTFFLQAFQNHATSTLECICSIRSDSIIITFISPQLFQIYYCVISSFHFHFTKTIIYVKIQSEIVQVLLCRPSNSSLLSNLFHFSFCYFRVSHRHRHTSSSSSLSSLSFLFQFSVCCFYVDVTMSQLETKHSHPPG